MKKIFISHSSIDKEVVDIFIDKILKLGLCFSSEDIAYTSREDTGVRTGKDIKEYIKENISQCDFVFFMISPNYAKSQVCLNEMGAAWATDREVIPIVLPDAEFDRIGWLYNDHKGIKLNDSSALDGVFEIINEKYEHKLKVSAWNRYKGEFLSSITTLSPIQASEIDINNEEELDLLDCREIFDDSMQSYNECQERITSSTAKLAEDLNRNTRNLNNLNNNPNSTTAQARTIMLKFAYDYNSLSDVMDKEIPKMTESFETAMNHAIKMRELSPLEEDSIQDERDAITGLVTTNEELLDTINETKAIFEGQETSLDKTLKRSQKRLIQCLDKMIETLNYCNTKANELLNYT